MPEYLSPGVYVEEVPSGPRPIEGVSTSTTGFTGLTERGPTAPRLVTSWGDYVRWFGGTLAPARLAGFSFLPLAVRGFFDNGGRRLFVARVTGAGAATARARLAAPGAGPDPNNFLELAAMGPGAWGNNLLIRVAAGSQAVAASATADWFRITILYYRDGIPLPFVDPTDNANLSNPLRREPDVLEDFDNLTEAAGRANSVINTINTASRLVQASWVNAVNPPFAARPQDAPFAPSLPASLDLDTADANTVLRVTALTRGAGGNNITAAVANGTAANTFRLTFDDGVNPAEVFDDIPDATPDDALAAINGISTLVAIDWALAAPTPDRPNDVAPTGLAGGSGGTPARVDLATGDPNVVLRVTAVAPGAGGNAITVGVQAGTNANTFQVNLDDGAGTQEDFDNIPDGTPAQVETDINGLPSTLVTVAFVRIGAPAPSRPANAAAAALAGGSNGSDAGGGTDGAAVTPTEFAGNPALPPDQRTGLAGLEVIDEISILAAPDEVNGNIANNFQITNALVNQCEQLRDRFAVLSVERGQGAVQAVRPPRDSTYGAVYYPWIRVFDPLLQDSLLMPPAGHVCGIYARSDNERGVHKAPANEVVRGIVNRDLSPTQRPLEFHISRGEHDILNPRGVNAIRDFRPDGRGIRVWGARTMSSDPLWRYVNVRRLFLFVEESIDEGTQWVVFEPNDEPLWARVRQTIGNFLTTVWRSGALQGATADEAFFVRCDRTTMTQDDIDNGRLICEIGIAPVKPAEFVIFRIQQKTLESQA